MEISKLRAIMLAQLMAFRLLVNLPDSYALSRALIAVGETHQDDHPLLRLLDAIAAGWCKMLQNPAERERAGRALLQQVELSLADLSDGCLPEDF